jgi:hypothetical protein
MSASIPAGSSADVRVRVGLVLAEVAIDRVLAGLTRTFEDSLIANNAPVEDLADYLLYNRDYLTAWRERTLQDMRAKLLACSFDETAA